MRNKITEKAIIIVPKKKVLPAAIDYILAALYIAEVVLIILASIQMLVYGNIQLAITYLSIFLGIIIVLFVISKSFSWFKKQTITIKNNKLNIIVEDSISNKNSVGGETRVTIDRLDDIKKKGNDLILFGDITKIEMKHKSQPKKFKLFEAAFNDDCVEFLVKYKERG